MQQTLTYSSLCARSLNFVSFQQYAPLPWVVCYKCSLWSTIDQERGCWTTKQRAQDRWVWRMTVRKHTPLLQRKVFEPSLQNWRIDHVVQDGICAFVVHQRMNPWPTVTLVYIKTRQTRQGSNFLRHKHNWANNFQKLLHLDTSLHWRLINLEQCHPRAGRSRSRSRTPQRQLSRMIPLRTLTVWSRIRIFLNLQVLLQLPSPSRSLAESFVGAYTTPLGGSLGCSVNMVSNS